MLRLHSFPTKPALLRLPDVTCNARLFQTTSCTNARPRGRPRKAPYDLPQSFVTPESAFDSAGGLSRHLEKAYTSSGSKKRSQADNKRVNVVSKELCNDIVERMKPSLLKHSGCDIIDINPGVGIWSSAVHNLLKPRNHYLMEPDHELYTPLLQPLLNEEGSTYKLIPKSGAVWAQLNNLLSPENLPQQVELKPGDPRLDKPNDTLLVLANLGWHPRKPFRAFPSVSLLVIYQLLSAIRAHSLFHRYGLVRMLVWLADDEGKQVLPRNIMARRKMAIEAEISCKGIYEIASSTVESAGWRRDEVLNLESSRKVLEKMKDGGIKTPKGRENLFQLQATKNSQRQTPEDDRLVVRRKWMDELEDLQERFAAGKFSAYIDENVVDSVNTSVNDILTSTEGQPRYIVNPNMERLRTLRTWIDSLKKEGKVPVSRSRKLTELKNLEAKFSAGEIPELVRFDADPPILERKPSRAVNPEMKRLRELRRYIKKFEKEGTVAKGLWPVELKLLEAKFKAGGIPQFVHLDTVPSIQDQRLELNPEWKLLRHLKWRVESRKKQGKTSQLSERLAELEAKFEAGVIKQYVEIKPEPSVSPVNGEDKDAEISAESKAQVTLPQGQHKGNGLTKTKWQLRKGVQRTEEFTRMKLLETRLQTELTESERAAPLFAEYEAILEMQTKLQTLANSDTEGLQREIDGRIVEFQEEIENLGGHVPDTFRHRLDNHRTFKNDPPVLFWDRREAEPLQVRPDEFYPNHELCLLDFHPDALWPVLRQDFPASYDVFEYILSSIFTTGTQSVKSALRAIAPGALEWLHAKCPSLTDIAKGGNPDLDLLTVRCLTLEMFQEIMEAWMRWPFRPDRFELMKKSGSSAFDPDEEAME